MVITRQHSLLEYMHLSMCYKTQQFRRPNDEYLSQTTKLIASDLIEHPHDRPHLPAYRTQRKHIAFIPIDRIRSLATQLQIAHNPVTSNAKLLMRACVDGQRTYPTVSVSSHATTASRV
jgi:hypothetical protein